MFRHRGLCRKITYCVISLSWPECGEILCMACLGVTDATAPAEKFIDA